MDMYWSLPDLQPTNHQPTNHQPNINHQIPTKPLNRPINPTTNQRRRLPPPGCGLLAPQSSRGCCGRGSRSGRRSGSSTGGCSGSSTGGCGGLACRAGGRDFDGGYGEEQGGSSGRGESNAGSSSVSSSEPVRCGAVCVCVVRCGAVAECAVRCREMGGCACMCDVGWCGVLVGMGPTCGSGWWGCAHACAMRSGMVCGLVWCAGWYGPMCGGRGF